MKNKLSNYIVRENMDSFIFKLSITLMFILSFYVVIISKLENSYFDSLIYAITTPWYILVTYIILSFILTISISQKFKKNYLYVQRLKTHKQYLKEYLTTIFKMHCLLFLTGMVILLITFNFMGLNYDIIISHKYGVYNVIYLVYIILKIYSITLMIALINGLLIDLLKVPILIIVNTIFYYPFLEPYLVIRSKTISSVLDIPWHPVSYILNLEYSSMFFELLTYMTYIALLSFICKILYEIMLIKYKKAGVTI